MRHVTSLLAFPLLAASFAIGQETKPTPAEQLTQLVAEYDLIRDKFMKELRTDRTSEGVSKANARNREDMKAWWEKALNLIRQHPAESAAVPVIEKYLIQYGVDNVELVGVLRKYHMADPRLARFVQSLYQSDDGPSWEFALEIADKHPDRTTRGRACYAVGWIAKWQLIQIASERSGVFVRGEKKEALRSHAESYLAKAAKEYPDVAVETGDEKVGPLALAALSGLANLDNLKVGKSAPEIEGADLGASKLKLSDQKGKVVLVVFWASWCGPCMADVPHEREIHEKLKGRPFAIIGVNGDEEIAKAKQAVDRAKIAWPSFAPDFGSRSRIPSAWNVFSWPTTYVIDHQGIIRHVNLRGDSLDEPIAKLVEAAEQAKASER
jgi:thiol-disulfide isomerase/thioredoxin